MRTLLRFACGFVPAALLTLTLLTGLAAPVLAAVILIPTVVLCLRRTGLAPVFLGLCVGLLWTWGYRLVFTSPAVAMAGQTAEITGMAVDYSAETAYGVQIPAEITCQGRTIRAQVWLYSDEPLAPGDSFTVTAELKAPEGTYYPAEGFHLLAYGKGTPELRHAARVPLRFLPRWIARQLELSLERSVPEDALGYALALATGNREQLTGYQRETLQISGIYHAMALSGMHLSVLMGALSLLVRKRRRRALLGIPLCIAFAVITGASASIVRAAVMQCLLLLAPLVGREEDPPTSLGAAALLLTAQNPWCVLGWGMQLSFASMAGILLLSDRLYKALAGRGSAPRRWIASSLSATFSAAVFTTPLMMAYFGRISLVSPLTNLLTGWAVSWCFRGSLLTALAGMALPHAGRVLGWCLAWIVRYVQLVAGGLSRAPFASLNAASGYSLGWVILTYAVMCLTLRTPRKERRWAVPICCILLSLTACLLLTMEEDRGVVLTALDVGQGQCLLLSGQGQTVMVDCGGTLDGGVGDLAANHLSGRGEDRVDALILTHYDSDHTGGVAELLRRIQVDMIFLPDMEPESEGRLAVEAAAQAQGTRLIYVTEEQRLTLGDGAITVYPPVTARGGNSGLSLLAETGNVSALITGDMDAEAERLLLGSREIPEVDILVAGHHGAKTSTSQALLSRTRPEIVLISVGKNKYGHPAEETLRRIADTGATVYRTDGCGTITLKGA